MLADPARERAVDPLGMGSQADKIADKILPDLSVNTVRARYISFLCWAVKKSKNSQSPLTSIHRIEAEHALEEVLYHRDEIDESHEDDPITSCPRIIGIRNGRQYLMAHNWGKPSYPERLYKNTAYSMYRPLMRSLGLLKQTRLPLLTFEGEKLADIFSHYRGREARCLSNISQKEQTVISRLIGFDYRQAEPSDKQKRRRDTYEKIRQQLVKVNYSSSKVLSAFANIGNRPNDTAAALHRAYVWELLSLGLSLSFSSLLAEKRVKPVNSGLKAALKGRFKPRSLGTFSPTENDTQSSHFDDIVALLRTALKYQPDKLGLDSAPINLAATLVNGRDPHEFIRRLVDRHTIVKQGDAWIELTTDKIRDRMPNKSQPFRVEPRNYRLDAFRQLLSDLGKLN